MIGLIANERTLLGARFSVVLIIVISLQLLIFGIPRLVRLGLRERQENLSSAVAERPTGMTAKQLNHLLTRTP